jgi:RNA polymerase sigma factor (sigma-70 family)
MNRDKDCYGFGTHYVGNRVADLGVLSKEELADLIKKYQSGDIEAGQKIILHNIKFMFTLLPYFANKYSVDSSDLISFAIEGMYKGMDKFDPELGFTFWTYCRAWVSQKIDRYMRKEKYGTFDYKAKKILFVSVNNNKDIPEERLSEFSVDPGVKDVLLEENVKEYLNNLTDREKRIISLRFGIGFDYPLNLGEVGEIEGISRERVRQIQSKVIERMKRSKKLYKLYGKKPYNNMTKEKISQEKMIDALRRNNGFVAETAREFGCVPQTIYRYMDRNPEIEEELKKIRAERKKA